MLLYCVRHGEVRVRAAALAGLLVGYAVITEYPAALLVAALGLYALTPRTGMAGGGAGVGGGGAAAAAAGGRVQHAVLRRPA